MKQDYGLFQDIEVTPSVDFSKLEEVLIIRRDEQEAAMLVAP
jgi:cell shape-determining protein MreC